MSTYDDQVKQLIDECNVDALVWMITPHACGCMGPEDDEPECPCVMKKNAILKSGLDLNALFVGKIAFKS